MAGGSANRRERRCGAERVGCAAPESGSRRAEVPLRSAGRGARWGWRAAFPAFSGQRATERVSASTASTFSPVAPTAFGKVLQPAPERRKTRSPKARGGSTTRSAGAVEGRKQGKRSCRQDNQSPTTLRWTSGKSFPKVFPRPPEIRRAWKLQRVPSIAELADSQRSVCPLVPGANQTMIIPTR